MTAERDLQAEQDHAEFAGWFEAQAYDAYAEFGQADMRDAFTAGMQAARDLAAPPYAFPQPAPELAAAMGETRRALDRLHAIRDLCQKRLRVVGMVDGKGVARKIIAIIDKPEGQ